MFPTSELIEVYEKLPPLNEIVSDKLSTLQSMGRDDAFFIVNLRDIYERLAQWRRLLPRVYPFYALKCNNDLEVARFLADAGIGFDCASKAELAQIVDLGVHPSRIVFANPCKQISHLQYARDYGVDLMTFDDVHELVKIKAHFPTARLLLRIQSSKSHRAKHNFNKKFGCELRAVRKLLSQAKHMELNVIGVSFHVGSLPEDVSSFSSTISDASSVCEMAEDLGFDMTVLDIGGGFPGVDTDHMSFKKVATVVNAALKLHFPESRGVQIIAEPGRYMVTPAFTLAVSVIAKRVVEENCKEHPGDSLAVFKSPGDRLNAIDDVILPNQPISEEEEARVNMYYVNDGVYGSFNNVLTDHAVVQPNLLNSSDIGRPRPSIIWGPTCDGIDCVVRQCLMPELGLGEWLYFRDMGAYTVTLSCDFNGIPRPLRFYVCDQVTWGIVYPSHQGQMPRKTSQGCAKRPPHCSKRRPYSLAALEFLRARYHEEEGAHTPNSPCVQCCPPTCWVKDSSCPYLYKNFQKDHHQFHSKVFQVNHPVTGR